MKIDTNFPNNPIKIGQNSKENHQIIDEAKETDIWLHLSNLPSCHAIITSINGSPIERNVIIYAANLVKLNTKYKKHKAIKVDYISVKNVKKTKNPGEVILKRKPSIIKI